MANNLISNGSTLDYTNGTGSEIASGEAVDLTGAIGVAHGIIPDGASGVLHMLGVFRVTKPTGVAWSAGAALNLGATGVTTGAGTPAGLAWADAASGDVSAEISINAGVGAS